MAFNENVILPGYLTPGVTATIETQTKTGTIAGETDTYVDLAFTLAATYNSTPTICGTPMLTAGEGSATTAITAMEVTAQSTTSITVRVHVDQAAGADKSNTITLVGTIIGKQGRQRGHP